ncbi:MAG TPA: ATP-binding protein, partial [Acidobacteriota bacterium]
ENWIAFSAFLITSIIVGSLSARIKHRIEESEKKQKEIEKLYIDLKQMFNKASQAEALKQSEQLKSALLDAVTHDLRTPLTSMKAAVTTLLRGNERNSGLRLDDEGRHEMLEVINSEIDRLNHLLEGLIGIAKLEAGAMQPQRSWSNIEEIVSISLARAARLTAKHKIQLDLEENLPAIRVDEKAIAEALYLLLENAAKYSPLNSVILLAVRKTNDALKVSIVDEGPGIPDEMREKVFDKFFRIPLSSQESRSQSGGLGMGLAIARGIVEAHGGQIWIEETPNKKGARVSFTIPLSKAE